MRGRLRLLSAAIFLTGRCLGVRRICRCLILFGLSILTFRSGRTWIDRMVMWCCLIMIRWAVVLNLCLLLRPRSRVLSDLRDEVTDLPCRTTSRYCGWVGLYGSSRLAVSLLTYLELRETDFGWIWVIGMMRPNILCFRRTT